MTVDVTSDAADGPCRLQPFALRDAPALIEAVFPAQKVSFEAQRERKAGAGQTLTALGSYWKGRKPLILVRSIVLGSLLPQTDDPEQDLEVFAKHADREERMLSQRHKGTKKRRLRREDQGMISGAGELVALPGSLF